MPYRALMRMVSPGGRNGRLSILIYHRVLREPDPIFPEEVDARNFERQMALVSSCFRVLPLSDAVRSLRAGTLPPRAACVTFDDGYADNASIALPILRKYNIPATVFVATGFLNGGRMWNDSVIEFIRNAPGPVLDLGALKLERFEIGTPVQRRKAIQAVIAQLKYLPVEARHDRVEALCQSARESLPNDLMLRTDALKSLHAAGIEIGAHTVNHPILARVDDQMAKREIMDGRDVLESIVRVPVRLFAYPNGRPGQDYRAKHSRLVKALGFDAAVSTAWGAARVDSDPYQLPRFTPWDRAPLKFMLRMVQNALRTSDPESA